MSGKGDTRRPTKVDRETFEERWERVFGPRAAMECPNCGEIELRPTGLDTMYECDKCHAEVNT